MVADAAYTSFGSGMGSSTVQAQIHVNFNTSMRVSPPSVSSSTLALSDGTVIAGAVTGISATTYLGRNGGLIYAVVSSGLTALRPYHLVANGNTTAFLAFEAEL